MRRLKFIIIIIVQVMIILWLGGFLIFQRMIMSYPKDLETETTDALVVLTGGRNRVAEALRLYNSGLSERLLISGVGHDVGIQELADQNKTAITHKKGQIILGTEATNTIENAIEVREVIRRQNISSVRLVTSNYHMPRSREEILALNPDIKIICHPVYSENVSTKWWKRPGSFYLIAGEFNKFIYVYLKNFLIRLKGDE